GRSFPFPGTAAPLLLWGVGRRRGPQVLAAILLHQQLDDRRAPPAAVQPHVVGHGIELRQGLGYEAETGRGRLSHGGTPVACGDCLHTTLFRRRESSTQADIKSSEVYHILIYSVSLCNTSCPGASRPRASPAAKRPVRLRPASRDAVRLRPGRTALPTKN